jgi:hypothetical protein
MDFEAQVRRLVEGGMPEHRAREMLAIGTGRSRGDVKRTDGRGREIPPTDLSEKAIERWGR